MSWSTPRSTASQQSNSTKKGDNTIVEYNGERTLEGLTKFLETDGAFGQAAPDAGEEADEDDDSPTKDEL